MSRQDPGPFVIVESLQKYEQDIAPTQLQYHKHRVMVSKEFTFDAAHHLHAYEGKCKNLHGHTYKVVFCISSYTNPIGISIDFAQIKDIWKSLIEPYLDHRYLNDTLPPMNTTAENIVYWLFEQMDHALSNPELVPAEQEARTEFVRLYETPTSYAEMRREWVNHA